MNKYYLALAPFFVLAVNCFGQQMKPAPSPTPPDDNGVVKISTNLIQIDVSVKDKKGHSIRDIRPDEIEIFENGKKKDITNFSFVATPVDTISKNADGKSKNETAPPVAMPDSTTEIRAENVHRTIALVVDDLTLDVESMHYTRLALKKFVEGQMQPGDLIAIIRTASGSGVLQQFTSDKNVLLAAVDRLRWNLGSSGGQGAFSMYQEDEDNAEFLKKSKETEDELREKTFTVLTLKAVNYIIGGMKDLPGRKSVLLLSNGFSLSPKNGDDVMEEVRRVVDTANRSSVVINAMDSRGLAYTGLTAADAISVKGALQINTKTGKGGIENVTSNRVASLFATQGGLVYLAKQTGGTSIVNDNDISAGIREILDDQSYYLVGYQPDEDTFDPKNLRFNKLEVKVKRPGASVLYRTGFKAVSDDRLRRPEIIGPKQLVAALASPFAANDIAIRLNAIFSNNATEGSFIRLLLHIRAQDLKFLDGPAGAKKAAFDVLAERFGQDGEVIEGINKTYTMSVKKEIYDRFLQKGFTYDLTIPINKTGAYQMRVGLRDQATNKIGTANEFVIVPKVDPNARTALSGVYLENLTPDEWNKRKPMGAAAVDAGRVPGSISDTSLRQFKRGTVLNYEFGIFNSKLDSTQKPNLTMQIRVFRDGKLILEGTPKPVSFDGQTDLQRISMVGSLNLGADMQAGDYILQIIIKDELAKGKKQISTQFVQFEIVE